MSHSLHARLFDGPIDIVGDVHGEIDALRSLLGHLGYAPQGEHPQGRRLVFLGDLCDRGPDSPAVIEWVHGLVRRNLAQCLLGNHELSLLRGATKNSNGWFFEHDHDRKAGRFMHCKPATASQRHAFLKFFCSMPLTLARDDLRLVHAAWVPEHIDLIAADDCEHDAVELHLGYEARAEEQVEASGLRRMVEVERLQWHPMLTNVTAQVPLLPATGLYDELYQMSNPVRVLTSGVERRATQPYFASGRWRMVERVPWWNEYSDSVPVIIGHYWRWVDEVTRDLLSIGEADLFADTAIDEWLGIRGNVYCVDFSVGGRYKEREMGRDHWGTRLAAVRWPEQELVFDEGERMRLKPAGL